MQRIKKIEIDNVSYEIGALSTGQVTAFLKQQRQALGFDESEKKVAEQSPSALEELWRDFVITGLNNALKTKKEVDEKLWNGARAIDEIDLVAFARLRAELLDF